ncbi:MAG: hypothetical protein COC22_02665, partial [Flavobacteriaceae bacterium]
MLKKIVILFLVFLSVISAAQNANNIKTKLDSLKQQDNLSEFIYVQLDEFTKNASIENLTIFKNISSKLWRNPFTNTENTAQLYFYINYAYNLKQFGFINLSIVQYEKALSFYENTQIKYNIIEYCLKPLANNYTRLGDVDRAEDILKITIEKAQKENNKTQIIASYSNLAIVFRTKGAYYKAINYLNLGLNLTTKNELKARIYSDLAINFLYLNEIEKVKKNIQLSNKFNVDNNSILTKNNITLANYFVQKKEFNKAIIQFENALKTALKAFGKHDREVAKIYNQIAEVYGQTNQSEKGLIYYQKSLSALLPKYHPKTIFKNPIAMYFYPENTLKEALDGRALLF